MNYEEYIWETLAWIRDVEIPVNSASLSSDERYEAEEFIGAKARML